MRLLRNRMDNSDDRGGGLATSPSLKACELCQKGKAEIPISDNEGEKAQSQMILKPVPSIEDESRMTDKQKGYLMFLMSTMRNESIREDLIKRLELLLRSKAAKIISALVEGDEEEASRFF